MVLVAQDNEFCHYRYHIRVENRGFLKSTATIGEHIARGPFSISELCRLTSTYPSVWRAAGQTTTDVPPAATVAVWAFLLTYC